MNKKLKVLLLQLPNPEFNLNARWGNVPLAVGYLKAMIHKENLDRQVAVEIPDKQDMDHAGDARIVNLIVKRAPDLLGFSLYLWNGRRSMYIAGEVKKRLPDIKIIVGGPEMTDEADYIFSNEAVDFGCFGDGEITFVEVVRKLLDGSDSWKDVKGIFHREGGKLVINPARDYLEDLNVIPSPVLMGTFNLREYPILSYETLRGCPCRCSYCSWATVPLRYFSTERIIEELTHIINSGVQTVRFIESNPLIHPEFETIFQTIKEVNKNKKVKFAVFSSFQQFTEEKIRLMKDCNFTFVEIGLQTVNPQTLKRLRRPPLNKQKFIDAIRLLDKYEIRYDIDTMLGLPGEGYADYEETVRFIKDNELGRFNTFPLMLMPNTQIRKDAENWGLRYLSDPPYYIIDSQDISSEELDKARRLNTSKQRDAYRSDTFLSVFEVPRLKHVPQPPQYGHDHSLPAKINKLIMTTNHSEADKGGIISSMEESIYNRFDYPFTLWIQANEAAGQNFSGIEGFIESFASVNPYVSLAFILECDSLQTLDANRYLFRLIQTEQKFLSPKRAMPALRKYVILPYTEGIGDEIKTYKLNEEQIKIIISLNISPDQSWQQEFVKQMSDTVSNGALIDISPAFNLNELLKIFSFLHQSGNNKFYFRNIFHYFIYEIFVKAVRTSEQDFIFMPDQMETMMTVDCEVNIQNCFTMDDRMRLYFAGLQMKMIQFFQN